MSFARLGSLIALGLPALNAWAACQYPNCIDCATSNWASNSFVISNYQNSKSTNSLTRLFAENGYATSSTDPINYVNPTVNASPSTGFFYPDYYLSERVIVAPYLASGPLTYYGPVGVFGPISSYGAIGQSAWNPTNWIDNWSKIYGTFFSQFDYFVSANGPLTAAGPLGSSGPYTTSAYCTTLPSINDFGKHLQAGGIWSVLGPAGPLGPVGPLGPLGPNGTAAVLYPPDSNGNYIDPKTGNTVTSVDVLNTDNSLYRTYPLYELYKASYALGRTNDLSWMVSDASVSGTASQTWTTQADYDQYVSVIALHNDATDVTILPLHLTVTDTTSGNAMYANEPSAISTGEIYQYVNQLFFLVKGGRTYTIAVKSANPSNTSTISYRLLVTGSTKYLSSSDITGDHQLTITSVAQSKRTSAALPGKVQEKVDGAKKTEKQ